MVAPHDPAFDGMDFTRRQIEEIRARDIFLHLLGTAERGACAVYRGIPHKRSERGKLRSVGIAYFKAGRRGPVKNHRQPVPFAAKSYRRLWCFR